MFYEGRNQENANRLFQRIDRFYLSINQTVRSPTGRHIGKAQFLIGKLVFVPITL